MSRRGWVLFAMLSVIWGIPYLLIRISVRDIAPPTLVFFRTAPAALAFLPFALKKDTLIGLRKHWRAVVVYSVGEVCIPWLLLFRSEQRIPSSLAGLLIATVPLIAVIWAWITRHDSRLGWKRLAGLVLGFAGVAVLVGVDVHGSDLIAVGEVGIVAIGYAISPFVVSRYLSEIPAIGVVGASFVLAALVYSPVALTHLPKRLSPEEITSVIILVVVCTAAAFLIFFALIGEVGPARATVVTYFNPVIAVVLGVAILHEHFTVGFALGVPLVLLGSFLGTGGGRQPVTETEGETGGTNPDTAREGLPALGS
jgi:drug/metabolite transporter (DMT)-like permease